MTSPQRPLTSPVSSRDPSVKQGNAFEFSVLEGLVHKGLTPLSDRPCLSPMSPASPIMPPAIFEEDCEGASPGLPRGFPERRKSDPMARTAELTGKTGSCRYMAPEVWAKQPYTHKADVFSFGILAVELLRRRRAYQRFFDEGLDHAATASKLRPKIASGLRPKLPRHWPDRLASLLTRCWAAAPDERPEFTHICAELEGMRDAVLAAKAAKKEARRRSSTSSGSSRSESEVFGAQLVGALDGRAPHCVVL